MTAQTIERHGGMKISVALAQWLAYQLSIWHEIATWYGFASLAEWPEKISASSPEDLYSNQLGVRIAGAIVLADGARSDTEYNLNMDAWIAQVLKRRRVVSLADARGAADLLNGGWWDSQRRIPELVACKDAGPPLVLHVADGWNGLSDGIAAQGFPLARAGS
jgi:hypothetical protein